jgi:hypothetical protein
MVDFDARQSGGLVQRAMAVMPVTRKRGDALSSALDGAGLCGRANGQGAIAEALGATADAMDADLTGNVVDAEDPVLALEAGRVTAVVEDLFRDSLIMRLTVNVLLC